MPPSRSLRHRLGRSLCCWPASARGSIISYSPNEGPKGGRTSMAESSGPLLGGAQNVGRPPIAEQGYRGLRVRSAALALYLTGRADLCPHGLRMTRPRFSPRSRRWASAVTDGRSTRSWVPHPTGTPIDPPDDGPSAGSGAFTQDDLSRLLSREKTHGGRAAVKKSLGLCGDTPASVRQDPSL